MRNIFLLVLIITSIFSNEAVISNIPSYSLFGKGDNPIIGDKKAREIDDILLVHISETHSLGSNSNKKIEKKS